MGLRIYAFVIFNHNNHKVACLSVSIPKLDFAQFEAI
jgi:hypothetical protein